MVKIQDKNIAIFANVADLFAKKDNFLFNQRFVTFNANAKICDLYLYH